MTYVEQADGDFVGGMLVETIQDVMCIKEWCGHAALRPFPLLSYLGLRVGVSVVASRNARVAVAIAVAVAAAAAAVAVAVAV
eukprot:363202-Chlamydomonas_euryale.AAC.4